MIKGGEARAAGRERAERGSDAGSMCPQESASVPIRSEMRLAACAWRDVAAGRGGVITGCCQVDVSRVLSFVALESSGTGREADAGGGGRGGGAAGLDGCAEAGP